MRDFFHGWRRKLGVLTLVMACVLIGGRVRSVSKPDAIEFPGPSGWQYSITSWEGYIALSSTWNSDESVNHSVFGPTISLFGIEYFYFNSPDFWIVRVAVYYWAVTIPLALLSTYLLLSKPRVTKPS